MFHYDFFLCLNDSSKELKEMHFSLEGLGRKVDESSERCYLHINNNQCPAVFDLKRKYMFQSAGPCMLLWS